MTHIPKHDYIIDLDNSNLKLADFLSHLTSLPDQTILAVDIINNFESGFKFTITRELTTDEEIILKLKYNATIYDRIHR